MSEPPGAADRLRARLKELGWTQVDLANAIEASAAIVSRWLSGERVPSLGMAFRIQNSAVALPADVWVPHASADESGEHPAVDTPRSSTG